MWGDTFVEEGNLTQYISHLRKALDDSSEDATRLIATIARKGYQFTEMSLLSKRQTVQGKPQFRFLRQRIREPVCNPSLSFQSKRRFQDPLGLARVSIAIV